MLQREKKSNPPRLPLNPYSLISENFPSLLKGPNIILQFGSSNGEHFQKKKKKKHHFRTFFLP
jgi:hypothetical protein